MSLRMVSFGICIALAGCGGEFAVGDDVLGAETIEASPTPAIASLVAKPSTVLTGESYQLLGSDFLVKKKLKLTFYEPTGVRSKTMYPSSTGTISLTEIAGAPGITRIDAAQYLGGRWYVEATTTLTVAVVSDTAPPGDTCGDGVCGASENPSSCASDCSSCGDGLCTGGENYSTCASDCLEGGGTRPRLE